MSYVRFSNQTSSDTSANIVVDIPATVTWNLPVTGSPGQATFRLPVTSSALNSDYIDPDGMSWVSVLGGSTIGDWTGYITKISETPGETIITATEWWGLLFRIPVQINRQFRHVTPGVIARSALGATPWGVLSAVEANPDIATWTFYGETVWDHINRLMSLSGQELYTGADQTFRWGTQHGNYYDTAVLLAPHEFIDAIYDTDATERATQVTAISSDNWYTARKGSGDFPAHYVIKENTNVNGLGALAENELIRRSMAINTLSGQLSRDHWLIDLGDTFSVFVPYAGLGEGRLRQCRVVSRMYDSSRDSLGVNVQLLSESQSVGVPLPIGGSRFVQGLNTERATARRGRRYLTEVSG